MNIDLSGKQLIITGSTQGVGEAIAKAAVDCNAAGIVITGRTLERAKEAVRRIANDKCILVPVAADLMNEQGAQTIVTAAIEAFGNIHGLVNAAGVTTRAGLLNASVEQWNQLFSINARAPFFLMQGVVNNMLQHGHGGSIVNILSMNAYCGLPEIAVYSATKGALSTLTKNAANAFMAERIRVNGINMGWAATPAEMITQSKLQNKGEDWAEKAAASMPLKRLLTVEEVARHAVFMLSEQSGLMSGVLTDLEQVVVGAQSH